LQQFKDVISCLRKFIAGVLCLELSDKLVEETSRDGKVFFKSLEVLHASVLLNRILHFFIEFCFSHVAEETFEDPFDLEVSHYLGLVNQSLKLSEKLNESAPKL
jgi:hypothetical protein